MSFLIVTSSWGGYVRFYDNSIILLCELGEGIWNKVQWISGLSPMGLRRHQQTYLKSWPLAKTCRSCLHSTAAHKLVVSTPGVASRLINNFVVYEIILMSYIRITAFFLDRQLVYKWLTRDISPSPFSHQSKTFSSGFFFFFMEPVSK